MSYDAVALDEAEKGFWRGLWDAAVEDAVVDLGIDMVRFGPVEAAVVAQEPEELALNFVLGGAAPGAVEHDHLAAAVLWVERHQVEYRVALAPGLPEFAAAEQWLAERDYEPLDGPAKLLRDGSSPAFPPPPGIDIYERVDPGEDEGFGDPLAQSFGMPGWASTFFFDLPGAADWRCYCAADGDEPVAYVAMHVRDAIAVLALASRPTELPDGIGQSAVLHRAIADAGAAGCTTIAVAEAGYEPAVADRQSLLRAGFEAVAGTFTWQSPARVRM